MHEEDLEIILRESKDPVKKALAKLLMVYLENPSAFKGLDPRSINKTDRIEVIKLVDKLRMKFTRDSLYTIAIKFMLQKPAQLEVYSIIREKFPSTKNLFFSKELRLMEFKGEPIVNEYIAEIKEELEDIIETVNISEMIAQIKKYPIPGQKIEQGIEIKKTETVALTLLIIFEEIGELDFFTKSDYYKDNQQLFVNAMMEFMKEWFIKDEDKSQFKFNFVSLDPNEPKYGIDFNKTFLAKYYTNHDQFIEMKNHMLSIFASKTKEKTPAFTWAIISLAGLQREYENAFEELNKSRIVTAEEPKLNKKKKEKIIKKKTSEEIQQEINIIGTQMLFLTTELQQILTETSKQQTLNKNIHSHIKEDVRRKRSIRKSPTSRPKTD